MRLLSFAAAVVRCNLIDPVYLVASSHCHATPSAATHNKRTQTRRAVTQPRQAHTRASWSGTGSIPTAAAKVRAFTKAREDWLNVVPLPGYAPSLNAEEGAWPVMESGLSSHAATTLDQLEALARSHLRAIQRRPGLINALPGQTGLTLGPPPQTLAFQISVMRRYCHISTRC
jgi:transposase